MQKFKVRLTVRRTLNFFNKRWALCIEATSGETKLRVFRFTDGSDGVEILFWESHGGLCCLFY